MRPVFHIKADKKDITAAVNDRLIELRLIDNSGNESDSLELRLDDRDNALAMPRIRTKLEVAIGYHGSDLLNRGIYTVDEVGLDGPTNTMVIRARAADLCEGLKAHKTHLWENVKIGDLVATIAKAHDLTPKVSASLTDTDIKDQHQTNESDMNLLTRLAEQYGAIAKPVANALLFVTAGQAKNAEGKNLPVISLTREDLSNWSVTYAERGKYRAVVAEWHDNDEGKRFPVKVGDNDPVFTMRDCFPEKNAAEKAAAAKLAALQRGNATIRLSCLGNPALFAEGKIKLSGVRPGINGEWIITGVTHSLGSGGYTCEIEGETPQ